MNDLPPRKDLPADLRDRLRADVNARIDAKIDAPRPTRSRGPLAVAAGVALLAAGAVLVGQAVTPDSAPPAHVTMVPADELLDEATMNATLDRCTAALKTSDLPSRAEWHPVIGQRTLTEGVVVAAMAGDKPVACQTTPSSVYMSYPFLDFEKDNKPPYLLLSSYDGVIVGIADPAWGRVGVYATGKDFSLAEAAATKDGFFVLNAQIPREELDVRIYPADDHQGVPSVDDMTPVRSLGGGGSTIDRPNAVTEVDKQLLASCTAATPSLAGNWSPGAAITREDDRYLLARDGTRIAVCVHHGKPADGREYTMTDLGNHTSQGFAPCPIAGVKPDGSLMAAVVAPEASNVEFDYGPYEIFHGAVTNGTYLAPAPAGKMPAWAVVHDPDIGMRYNGPPAC